MRSFFVPICISRKCIIVAKPEERESARKLRRQGKSIKDIAREVDVSSSTVSRWVRDIKLTDLQLSNLKQQQKQWKYQNKGAQRNKNNAQSRRLKYQNEGRLKAKEADILHMQGCMLYWAEGAKDRNRLEFVNSDVNMIELFIDFLRISLKIPDSQIHARIHCHSDNPEDISNIQEYWSDILKLPLENFGKVQIKNGSKSRKNRLEYGVCGLRVESTSYVQHIFGAIQEYGGFDNPDWLF